MDSRQLTQGMRLAIPIVIAAAALVLVDYGLPHANPLPAQAVTPINIIPKRNPAGCEVVPFHAFVKAGGRANFRNLTKDTVWLLLPQGQKIFLPAPGQAAMRGQEIVEQVASKALLSLDVKRDATLGDHVEYEVYSNGLETFCEGHSHPEIIVD